MTENACIINIYIKCLEEHLAAQNYFTIQNCTPCHLNLNQDGFLLTHFPSLPHSIEEVDIEAVGKKVAST